MMKRLLILPFFALSLLSAQPVLTPTGPATVTAGGTVNVVVSASGTAGSGLTSAQFTMALPASITMGTPVSNQSAGGIFAQCLPTTGICLLVGFDSGHNTVNLNAIADGSLVTLPLQVSTSAAPATVQISLSGVLGASGTLVAGGVFDAVSAGPAYTLKILSRCDVNSDGSINLTDVQLAINAILNKTACPIAGDTCTPAVVVSIIAAALGGACLGV